MGEWVTKSVRKTLKDATPHQHLYGKHGFAVPQNEREYNCEICIGQIENRNEKKE